MTSSQVPSVKPHLYKNYQRRKYPLETTREREREFTFLGHKDIVNCEDKKLQELEVVKLSKLLGNLGTR